MISIDKLGWDSFFDIQFQSVKGEELDVGRVLKEERHRYTLCSAHGVVEGEVSGHFHFSVKSRSDYPTVGDWVTFRADDHLVQIESVLERKSVFSRNRSGSKAEEQVIASNIDYLCIVSGLDGGRNYTLRGIERYITLAIDGGIKPILVLNKSDLCIDREIALLQARSLAEDIPIYLVSTVTQEGIDDFAMCFPEGASVAFTGPSGVGKSSLINCLLGTSVQKIGVQRESDLRGRHTTSSKELFFLKSGAMLIDTPGMRELQLWGNRDSLDDTYSEIHEAAQRCRFKDCSHQNEPGCAVLEMLVDGSLEMGRYENYLDLRLELAAVEHVVKGKKSLERKAKGKELSKLIRESQKIPKRQ